MNLVIDSISCFNANDASIHAQPTGGTLPISYSWSNSITGVDSIHNLTPGNYSITISDATGCTGTGTTIITQPAQLSYTANFTDILCNGANDGSITLTPSGGTPSYSYQWNPAQGNTSSATGLNAGSYSVTILDANSCSVTVSSTITEPTLLTATVATTNASCDASLDGTATATVSSNN